MKKILITGANGQLGRKIKDLSITLNNIDFYYTDIEELNICNNSQLDSFIESLKPDIIINCAAYTNVELAETNKTEAYLLNATAAKYIAENAKKHNAKFIHISTDYVFDGQKNLPYIETDKTNPISIYGKSKLEGEIAVINSNKNSIIIRTSWLFSEYGKNFALSILSAARTKNELSIVYDQIGTPTYAGDLASCLLSICENYFSTNNWNKGIYHYSNLGVASWYDFAFYLIKINNININIMPIISDKYPSKVKRPRFSILNKFKIISIFEISIPHWTTAVDKFQKNFDILNSNKN